MKNVIYETYRLFYFLKAPRNSLWCLDTKSVRCCTKLMCFKLIVLVSSVGGEVIEVGSEVTKFSLGDVVGVGCFVDSCRKCSNCRKGTHVVFVEHNHFSKCHYLAVGFGRKVLSSTVARVLLALTEANSSILTALNTPPREETALKVATRSESLSTKTMLCASLETWTLQGPLRYCAQASQHIRL